MTVVAYSRTVNSRMILRVAAGAVLPSIVILAGCSATVTNSADLQTPLPSAPESSSPTTPVPTPERPSAQPLPVAPPSQAPQAPSEAKSGNPTGRYATLSVPSVGIKNAVIIRQRGVPDDAAGTEVQERGLVSAPFGAWGGVEVGQIGNFFLAGHRTSADAPMVNVPEIPNGAKILVARNGQTFTYIAAEHMKIDFRQASSRALQMAAVPGHPGQAATRAAIVLSTCATPEDNAAGLTYRDQFHNPAHRLVVVGYLAS